MNAVKEITIVNRREALQALSATSGGLAVCYGLQAAEHDDPVSATNKHQPIVEELIMLLKSRPDLARALEESIRKADRPDVQTFPQYYDFLDKMVTLIPTDRNLNPVLLTFYYLIDLSPQDFLQTDASFQRWTRKFAQDWGAFLDTTESAAGIKSFFSNPSYHIEDYYVAPSGWLTFNQFFARQVRPGKRPVDALDCVDGTGYQFTQDRGLIVIESSLGLVAVLPIGMAQVSSVTLTAEVGLALAKGEEFGFFSFGGSDIVTMFEAGKVQLDAEIGTHYNQGRRIGHAVPV